jgi:phosphotransferase system IIB component
VLFLISKLAVIDWLNENFWWPVILFVVAVIIIVRIALLKPQKKGKVDGTYLIDEILRNLGGIENLTDINLDGSRLKFSLKEIELANLQAFKEIGATGVFISGKNVKMVLPYNMENIVVKIKSDLNGG